MGLRFFGFDLSREGLTTKFTSPPKIRWCEFRHGISETKLVKKLGQGLEQRAHNYNLMLLGSGIICLDENCSRLCIRIAGHLEWLLKLKWKVCPIQGFCSLVWSHTHRCVSWRKTICDFKSLRCENTLALFIAPPRPLKFHFIFRSGYSVWMSGEIRFHRRNNGGM